MGAQGLPEVSHAAPYLPWLHLCGTQCLQRRARESDLLEISWSCRRPLLPPAAAPPHRSPAPPSRPAACAARAAPMQEMLASQNLRAWAATAAGAAAYLGFCSAVGKSNVLPSRLARKLMHIGGCATAPRVAAFPQSAQRCFAPGRACLHVCPQTAVACCNGPADPPLQAPGPCTCSAGRCTPPTPPPAGSAPRCPPWRGCSSLLWVLGWCETTPWLRARA